MTDKEYREYPAISRSELFKILDSPEKFKYYKENPVPPTPALVFGQLFHCMLLQPEEVWEQFAVMPNVDRRTKDGKAVWEQFLVDSAGKTVVSMDMAEQAADMCRALREHPIPKIRHYIEQLLSGEKEKVFFWVDELTGEQCKCRVDCISEVGELSTIVDVKTTTNADTESFIKDAIKYGYDFQAAMYTEGVQKNIGKQCIFVFIVIEKEPPYSVNILQADNILLRRGGDLYREAMGIYHDCKITDNWYGYLGKYDMINNLALPAWLAKEYE